MDTFICLITATVVAAAIVCPFAELFSKWKKEMDETPEEEKEKRDDDAENR